MLLASMAVAFCGACSPIGFVPRYPYLEDRDLALADETLTLTVHDDSVEVDALFHFVEKGSSPRSPQTAASSRDVLMSFPIPPPRGAATEFTATLEGAIGIERLPISRGTPNGLPAGEAVESIDVLVPGGALRRHGGLLRAKYRQAGRGTFAYTLRTGAYWRGPIGKLVVVVVDSERRVASARLEGEPMNVGEARVETTLFDVEPRSGITLELR
jgi:hypothetical protein